MGAFVTMVRPSHERGRPGLKLILAILTFISESACTAQLWHHELAHELPRRHLHLGAPKPGERAARAARDLNRTLFGRYWGV
jgi:hypothetical protein